MNGSYLSVRVGSQWYGIPVERVIEVLNLVAVNELPGAGPDVLGLMTLREVTMPVIDLRRRFGIKNPTLHLNTPMIAFNTDAGAVAIVVDDVDDVEVVTKTTDYHEEVSPYVIAVSKQVDKLLMILDIARLQVNMTKIQASQNGTADSH